MPTPLVLKINESERNASFWATSNIPSSDPRITQLLFKCDFMNALVPIKKIEFERQEATNIWTYDIELYDGRKWSQTLDYTNPIDTDPPMTFDIQDPWRLTEFNRQRDIRELCINFKTSHNVERILINYDEDI